jgi:hypothetical protein
MTDIVVTQEDIDAAKNVLLDVLDALAVNNGAQKGALVQAFARHRIAQIERDAGIADENAFMLGTSVSAKIREQLK